MQHLYSSIVEVQEQKMILNPPERPKLSWVPVAGLGRMACRIDLQFMRPGKDAPPAINAGVIPDREGIMFCAFSRALKAGMRIVTKPDARGNEVVKGTFDIKEIPGEALGFYLPHHIEVKVVESTQSDSTMPNIPDNVIPDNVIPGP